MSEESDRMVHESQKRRWPLVLAFLSFYLLSWGPVFALCTRLTMTVDASGAATCFIPEPVALFYLPIIWLEENVPGAGILFDLYTELFQF